MLNHAAVQVGISGGHIHKGSSGRDAAAQTPLESSGYIHSGAILVLFVFHGCVLGKNLDKSIWSRLYGTPKSRLLTHTGSEECRRDNWRVIETVISTEKSGLFPFIEVSS